MENLRVQHLLVLGLILGTPGCLEAKPRKLHRGGMELQSHYLKAIAAHRRLERVLEKQELLAVMGIGLLNGARQAEAQMEQHLADGVRELLEKINFTESSRIVSDIDAIEHQMSRDRRALDILTRAVDVLAQKKDEQEFLGQLRDMAQQQREEELLQQELSADLTDTPQLGERLGRLRRNILKQVPQMKLELDVKIEKALKHFLDEAPENGVLAKAKGKMTRKRQANRPEQDLRREQDQQPEPSERQEIPEEMRIIKSILSEAHELRFQDDFRENLVDQQEQQQKQIQVQERRPKPEEALEMDIPTKSPNITVKPRIVNRPEKQEEAPGGAGSSELENDDEEEGDTGGGGGGGGGGLVGIIGGLSGGEGGSDVGALIGALTGVVSTLFGPGGLDVEGLIKTSTSLIAGLLAGNKNFGLVLGQYVGTALDGLSGGGGADPEEEGPPQPLTFTKNFITSFLEAKFTPISDDVSEERHGSEELPRPRKKKEGGGGGWAATAASHFDSGGFVKQVASHLVSNALGLLLNAGLGASGGASSASKGIFASSSSAHHGGGGGEHHHRSWSTQEQGIPYEDDPF
nr:fl(2)d-associated complex component [Drosophila bipectinata]